VDITPEALRIAFHKGQDDTHNPRDLPIGFGTRCWDIDLRSGIYEPRPGPSRFAMNSGGSATMAVKRYPMLFLPVDLPSGQTALLTVEPQASGAGSFNSPVFYKKLHFEGESGEGSLPQFDSLHDRAVVLNRESHYPHACQVTESCEAAAYGNKLYVCNLNDPRWSAFATVEIDLRDLKASHEVISTWPKARHICMSPSGYPVFLDVYARGPLSVEASDQPLSFTGAPTFGANYDEIPGGAGDRNMKGIFHQNGLVIFQKRSCFVLWGPPPEWEHELVLNSIGTLSPSSVVSIGQYIYFLSNDGVVKRMTGEKGVVENVGAYTPDGRSPIENSLKGYYTKPSGEAGTVSYDGVGFGACPTHDYVVVGPDDVRLARNTAVAGEGFEGTGGNERWRLVPDPEDNKNCSQSFSTPVGDPTWGSGFVLPDGNVPGDDDYAVGFYVRKRGGADGDYTLRVQIATDVEDADDDTLEILGEATVVINLTGDWLNPVPHWVNFRLADAIEIDQEALTPVHVRAIIRVIAWPLAGGDVEWRVQSTGYARGKNYDPDGMTGQAAWFRARFCDYVSTSGYLGNTDHVADARWKIANIVGTTPEDTTMVLQCNPGSGWVDIDDGAGLVPLTSDPTYVNWRVAMTTTRKSRTPLLTGLFLHHYVGGNAGDEPFAVNWDGRYCLSLLRRDSYKRDLFVWDNEAWSIWRADRAGTEFDESGGFHWLAVIPDDSNRQRLVFYDPEQHIGNGYVNCLLFGYDPLYAHGWRRIPVPQFISREMMIAGGMAGKVKESYFRYTDLGMTGTIRKGLAFNGGDWMLLDQDIVVPPGTVNHDHLFTERPYTSEGRFCRAYVGYLDEFPRGVGMPGNALVKVQDWVLVPFVFGFRENFHSGA
jgi:hypothetical protein